MSATQIHTKRLNLVAQTLEEVRAQIDAMDDRQRAELSADWLARLDAGADLCTLGFTIVHRALGGVIGTCGFKGPPGADGTVEIAYGLAPEHQGFGYATEAADALVAYRHLTLERQVPPSRIILTGRSLGSAVAVELATRAPGSALPRSHAARREVAASSSA